MIVMCVCHCDNTNSFGGLEKQAFSLARELSKKNDVVMLSSTRKFKNVGWDTIHGIKTLRLWTYTTPQVAGKKLPASILWAFQLLIWLVFNRKKIEIFHCHQIRIHAFVAAFMNKFFNMKTILKSGVGGKGADINVISTHKYFGKLGQRFVINNTTKFISITETISADLISAGVSDNNIAVIPNGIEISNVEVTQQNYEKLRNNFIYLGRLDSDKNIVELVNAAISLHHSHDLLLNIYGKGELEEKLNKIVQDKKAESYIKIHTYVDDIPSRLKQNCWLVLPSNAEGLSNAMIESMVFGVVPLVTKVSGAIDHIKHEENGYFIEGFSEEGIKSAMLLAMECKESHWLEMSNSCKINAFELFAMGKVGSQYEALYNELLGNSK